MPTTFVATVDDAVDSGVARTFVLGSPPPLSALIGRFPDWEIHGDGHFPTMRQRGRVICWASQWFGKWAEDGERLPVEVEGAWSILSRRIAKAFGPGAQPMTTPATTGRDLWLRSLRDDDRIPTMSTDMQRLVRSMSGQGRMEVVDVDLDRGDLFEYDQRFAYGALVRRLPIGDPVHYSTEAETTKYVEENPFALGKVWVTWTAPSNWAHRFGLLTMLGDNGPEWPLAGRGWVDLTEYDLARRQGWRMRTFEALVWKRTGEPLRTWSDRIHREMAGASTPIRHAFRVILLHSIGSFQGSQRKTTKYGEHPPDDATGVVMLPDGAGFKWSVLSSALWPETHHPEWSSTIWARARRRLLDAPGVDGKRTGALHTRPGSVLAFRTDAIWSTEPLDWADDGAPGRYRLKSQLVDVAMPTNSAQLMRLRRGN